MSAFRIFRNFAELLDINVPRAAAAWLRLNADGTTSQRTAAETLADIGGGVTNATVNTAISTNTGATRTALGLGVADTVVFAAITCGTFGSTGEMVFSPNLYMSLKTGGRFAIGTTGGSPMLLDSAGTLRFRNVSNSTWYPLASGKVTAEAGDVEVATVASGIIVKSPNGNRWRLTPDNSGASVWTAL